ncbi:MAG TPA: 4-hydroxythreonine-4-phosphate dehydrogenase PdxA [Microvirga sp.]|nr:4-hydroxythreonine-4-phosphate dehydrogenase PdxA [Microvirga sp.]
MASTHGKPTVALAMGDPAGISAELAAKLLALEEVRAAARLIVVGDKRVFDRGAAVAGVALDLPVVAPGEEGAASDAGRFVDLGHLDPDTIRPAAPSAEGGRFALANFRYALRLAADGRADAVCFMPFNKQAMKLAHPPYEDEISYSAEIVGASGAASEFNILGELWNARVTSHVPLAAVAGLITVERVLSGLVLTDRSMRAAGFARPRIAVAGLNPHAGEGGNFGREEIDVIAPAVAQAQAAGIAAEGPFPSDTVFLRARGGDFDAVLTMYHDQGQIAMKLMGFDRGVTLLGGFPFAIVTPAHGTAYDIAGRGVARVGAAREALLLAASMASRRSAAAQGR